MEPTTDPKQIREAINNNPELFDAILSSNPLLAKMLAAGLCLSDYPETTLAQAVSELPEPSAPAATPSGVLVTLADNRGGAGHEAYLFSVAPTQDSVRAELQALVGERAVQKLLRYASPRDLNQPLAEETHIALFINSNNKPLSRLYSIPEDTTTQQEDLSSAGYTFADVRAVLILCARLRHKVTQGNVEITDVERDLIEKLSHGALQMKAFSIGLDHQGDLIVLETSGRASPLLWTCGSPK